VDPVNPRLSGYQARFLLWLIELYQEIEAEGDKRGMWRDAVPVPRARAGQSRSDSASISRAVRRLEDRGLIERLNHVSGAPGEGYATQMRTTHIRLTESGRAVAERLTETTWWRS
jgi:DNA-binding MarR family transcriptional regulator